MAVKSDFKHALIATSLVIALLWSIEILDNMYGLGLMRLGVYPREPAGIPGILFAPLIHGSWNHLLSNSIALLVLGTVLVYGYPRAALPMLLLVYFIPGICVWLFARSNFHIGASGLTHGMMFFIFTIGIFRRDRLSIALSLIVFFLYGGMIWSIFPQEPDISYESHFFGALSGMLAAYLLKDRDPSPPEKRYDWEDAGQESDDDSTELPAANDHNTGS
jgi:membrane associated rhomboid family serine protease